MLHAEIINIIKPEAEINIFKLQNFCKRDRLTPFEGPAKSLKMSGINSRIWGERRWRGTWRTGERGGCDKDVLHKRRINKKKKEYPQKVAKGSV